LAEDRRFELSPAMIVITLGVIACMGVFAYLSFGPKPASRPKPVLTPEARAYLPYLKLSDVQPQTSESYVQKSLFEILGKITNAGPKTVTDAQVTCIFRDYSGREVKRELASVVGAKGGALAPNATKSFRLAFDDLPDTWGRTMPDFVIAQISFQ
jgi:hypothetical protein